MQHHFPCVEIVSSVHPSAWCEYTIFEIFSSILFYLYLVHASMEPKKICLSNMWPLQERLCLTTTFMILYFSTLHRIQSSNQGCSIFQLPLIDMFMAAEGRLNTYNPLNVFRTLFVSEVLPLLLKSSHISLPPEQLYQLLIKGMEYYVMLIIRPIE